LASVGDRSIVFAEVTTQRVTGHVTTMGAEQAPSVVLGTAERQPEVVRRLKRDLVVVLSDRACERPAVLNVDEIQRYRDCIRDEAKARGLSEETLASEALCRRHGAGRGVTPLGLLIPTTVRSPPSYAFFPRLSRPGML
jgi:hypothetical protein